MFEEKRLALRGKFKRIEHEAAGPFFAGEKFHIIDDVWGTVLRYIDVFDRISDFGLLEDLSKLRGWRAAISEHPSVANAAPEGYPERLMQFLCNRNSYISAFMNEAA